MKRPLSFILAVLVGWGSVTQPARAFAPPLIYAAYMTASVSGSTYTLAALAGAIGIAGMYMTIQDAQNNAVRIPVGPNANNQPPAPAAAPSTTGTAQTASARCGEILASLTTNSTPNGCNVTTSYQSNGTSWYSGGYYACGYNRITSSSNCPDFNRTYSNDGTYSYYQASPSVTCPSGYTMSGSTCVLQNARQATDDKTCDILVTNGQFATASDMNCPATVDGTKLSPMLRDGKVIAYGTNSSGQPLMWEVTPGAQTYTVKEYQQIQTATQTQIKTTTATVDAATSTVTSVQTQTAPGSMSAPSATTAPTVTTTADPTTATNTPTVTQDQTKPADLQTCGLPGTPACAIDDTQFDGKDNFTAPRNTEISDKLDQNKTQLENSKDSKPDISSSWLPSLMPGQATACAPLVFDFSVNSRVLGNLSAPNINLDICYYLNLVRDILGYLLGIFTVFYVWRSFTGSNQGA